MKRIGSFIFWVLGFFISPSFLIAQDLPKIVVWDLDPRNIKAEYAQELTSILVSEIAKLKKFEVYSQENVRTIAGWTEERMKLGCTDTQCLLALGQMDIAQLVSGSVGKIGTRYSVSLSLFNTQYARSEDAISEFCRTEDELIELVQNSARKLLGISPEQEKAVEKVPAEKVHSKVVEAPEKCEPPKWNIGDSWIYRYEDGSSRKEKVVGEKKDFYLVELEGGVRLAYEKNSMNLKMRIFPGGKRENMTGWVKNAYNFPLFPGKQWSFSYSTATGDYLNEFQVSRIEDVSTLAGRFRCFKIDFVQTGRKSSLSGWVSYWYSPKTKRTVKRKVGGTGNYWAGSTWLQGRELISYELK
ncbi:MAG: hypothetical protein AMJ94_14825 [Deltaproteobacteria bacterium SM23_61]|nr:MAG: hypothetical protein AMJ94_14825 [Deltaproteobacteria bacterium SM23_61]